MLKKIKIKKVTKIEEDTGPFILTINGNNQLIGDMARAFQCYMKVGKEISTKGHYIGENFIIETINHMGKIVGSQINTYSTMETIKLKTKSQIRVYA